MNKRINKWKALREYLLDEMDRYNRYMSNAGPSHTYSLLIRKNVYKSVLKKMDELENKRKIWK